MLEQTRTVSVRFPREDFKRLRERVKTLRFGPVKASMSSYIVNLVQTDLKTTLEKRK